MEELKKVFDACRTYRQHNLEEAAEEIGFHITTVNRLFKGDLEYPDNPKEAVCKYIYETGLIKSIQKLGLDPDATKDNLTACIN